MPRHNRRDIVSPDEVDVYHCYSRCHNGSYLCGYDRTTGKDYEHRKDWIADRQDLLATVFALELLAFAILDNHMHHVIRTRPDVVETWSDEEVVRRWFRLHPPRSASGKELEVTDDLVAGHLKDKDRVSEWRDRLGSLSWYMKELKEYISKRANRESGSTGSFFDSRFKSPRLADPITLLICLMYVELNAVRADIVEQPEQYKHCSFRLRSRAHELRHAAGGKGNAGRVAPDAYLQPIPEQGEPGNCTAPIHRPSDKGILPMSVAHYLSLVDWVGRLERPDKRGKIPNNLALILERLGGTEELLGDSKVLYQHLYGRAGLQVKIPTPAGQSNTSAA